MAWLILLVFFAGCGLLSLFWLAAGMLHETFTGMTIVFPAPSQLPDGMIRRWRWMKNWGLATGTLLIVGQQLSKTERRILNRHYPDVEFCSWEEFPSRLELECKHFG